jgi:hypothetical protein
VAQWHVLVVSCEGLREGSDVTWPLPWRNTRLDGRNVACRPLARILGLAACYSLACLCVSVRAVSQCHGWIFFKLVKGSTHMRAAYS